MAGGVSYEIGAIFAIGDEASPVLERVGGLFETLATQMKEIREQGATLFSGVTESIGGVEAATARMGEAMTGALGRIDSAVSATSARIDALAASLANVNRAAAEGAAGGGGGGAGGRDSTVVPNINEDRRNADAINRNEDQIYRRQYAAAKREDEDRARAAAADDGITIPPPPRTGITTYNRPRETPGPIPEMLVPPAKTPGKADGHNSMTDLLETAAGWELTHKALTQAADVQGNIFRGVQAFNMDPDSPAGQRIAAGMEQAAQDAAMGTSYPVTKTSAGIPTLARPFGREGEEGAADFMRIYPGAAKAAEALELMNPKNTFEENLRAEIEIAHQNREYDPDKLAHQYNVLGAITSMIPGGTFSGEANAMGYVVPMARAAGASGERTEMQVGALQQAGLRGTIAATTLRQELVGLTKGGGPMQAHLGASQRHEVRTFEDDLNLRDPEAARMLKSSAHVDAMRDTGLIDAKGRDTFLFTKDDEKKGLGTVGGINVEKANSILAKWAEGKTPAEVAAEYYKLFGVRGENAPALLAASQPGYVDAFIQGVLNRVNTPGGYLESYRNQASQDLASQQAGQALARLSDVATHIGQITLPIFQGALENAVVPLTNWLAKQTAPDAQGNFTPGQTIFASGAVGTAVGALIGGIIGFFAGGVGAIPGAAGGAAIGGSLGAGAGLSWQHTSLGFMPVDPSGAGFNFDLTAKPFPGLPMPPAPAVGSTAAAPAPITVTVNMGGVTNNGVGDEATFRTLMSKMSAALTQGIHDALSHATTDPAGTHQSPYVYPGAF
jgi:hypothetical protein